MSAARQARCRITSTRTALGLVGSLVVSSAAGCHPAYPAPTTSLRVTGNVADAQVTIDDMPLGSLAYVAQHGVALPPGRHRITVERAGYFPWDALLHAEEHLIVLQVKMVPIPD